MRSITRLLPARGLAAGRLAARRSPARRPSARLAAGLAIGALLFAPVAAYAEDRDGSAEANRCPGGRSKTAAMWLSIAHPGVGEWFLNDWGYFNDACPQRKFWLGFIPFYGWPGYLQVKSAIDASNCRTNDEL